jgi:hypothetical protein
MESQSRLFDRIGRMLGHSSARICARGTHIQPARLGTIHGAEWMHCRGCGCVWERPSEGNVRFLPFLRSPVVETHTGRPSCDPARVEVGSSVGLERSSPWRSC